MKTFDGVVLLEDVPEEGLVAGMVGTIIDIYEEPNAAYEVEFCNTSGDTLAQLALEPHQVRPHSVELDGTGVAINDELYEPA